MSTNLKQEKLGAGGLLLIGSTAAMLTLGIWLNVDGEGPECHSARAVPVAGGVAVQASIKLDGRSADTLALSNGEFTAPVTSSLFVPDSSTSDKIIAALVDAKSGQTFDICPPIQIGE